MNPYAYRLVKNANQTGQPALDAISPLSWTPELVTQHLQKTNPYITYKIAGTDPLNLFTSQEWDTDLTTQHPEATSFASRQGTMRGIALRDYLLNQDPGATTLSPYQQQGADNLYQAMQQFARENADQLYSQRDDPDAQRKWFEDNFEGIGDFQRHMAPDMSKLDPALTAAPNFDWKDPTTYFPAAQAATARLQALENLTPEQREHLRLYQEQGGESFNADYAAGMRQAMMANPDVARKLLQGSVFKGLVNNRYTDFKDFWGGLAGSIGAGTGSLLTYLLQLLRGIAPGFVDLLTRATERHRGTEQHTDSENATAGANA